MPAKPFGPLGRRRPAACTFRSLPAENARSPAPVMMPTHRSSRAANSSHTAASSSFASACSAFSTSGRFSVTMRTRPSSCTMQYWWVMFAVLPLPLREGAGGRAPSYADHRVVAQHADVAFVHSQPIRQHLGVVLAKQRCRSHRWCLTGEAHRPAAHRVVAHLRMLHHLADAALDEALIVGEL